MLDHPFAGLAGLAALSDEVQGPAAAMVHSKVRYVLSSYFIARIVLTNGTKIS